MKRAVLLVSADAEMREAIAAEMEDDGHDVTCCPGPSAPDYMCVGGRGGHCALAAAADAVVLDTWLESDRHRTGAPSWHLALYYLAQGAPVVALVGPDGLPGRPPLGVVAIPRDASPRTVADGVKSVLSLALTS